MKGILKGIYAEIRKMDKEREGQRKSLLRQYGIIKNKLTKQYEAIESGVIALDLVAERIRELQGKSSIIKDKLDEIKSHGAMPLHLFREESLGEFQTMIRERFLAEDRVATKAYLKLFIEKIVINLPGLTLPVMSNVLLAAPENKTAVGTL